ncbi:MAG TPA: Flp family type IVb pilin [Negativicutes bacterium]|nr:Flp family type IVb pilin [Negativicutes bacterium]
MLTYAWYYLNSRFGNQKGQGMVEYGLILALVSVAVIAAMTPLADSVKEVFGTVSTELNKAGK